MRGEPVRERSETRERVRLGARYELLVGLLRVGADARLSAECVRGGGDGVCPDEALGRRRRRRRERMRRRKRAAGRTPSDEPNRVQLRVVVEQARVKLEPKQAATRSLCSMF